VSLEKAQRWHLTLVSLRIDHRQNAQRHKRSACLGCNQPTPASVNLLLPIQSVIFFIANAMEGSKGQLLTGAT